MRALVPVLALTLAVAACAPNAATPAVGKSPAPRATTTPRPSDAPSPSASPQPGPSVGATNTPTVRVSAAAPPASPTPAPTFGPIVAGLRADGQGRPARAMDFGLVLDLEVADDGAFHLTDSRRWWRFAAGGEVALVGGGRRRRVDNLAGRPATAAGFDARQGLQLTREGGVPRLLTNGSRQYRLGADGTLEELLAGAADERIWAVVPRADGAVSLVVATPSAAGGWAAAWWTAPKGQAATRTRACTAAEADLLGRASEGVGGTYGTGLRGAGIEDALVLFTADGEAWRLSPAGGTPSRLDFGADEPTHLDGRGRFYAITPATGRVTRLNAGAPAEPLAARLPADFRVAAIASDAAGTVYVAGHGADRAFLPRVLKLAGAAPEEVAGAVDLALASTPDPMIVPRGLVAPAADEVLAADALRGQILRLRPGQAPEALYGDPAGEAPVEDAPAKGAKLEPGPLARDAEGDLYLVHADTEVWRVDGAGKLHRVYALPPGSGESLTDLAVAPDGTAFVHVTAPTSTKLLQRAFRLDGRDARTEIPLGGERLLGMATGPDGELRLALQAAGTGLERTYRLVRWTADDGVEEIDARIRRAEGSSLRSLAADGLGRWWFELTRDAGAGAGAVLVRFDPTTRQTTELAGPDTGAFAGDTADEGLGEIRHPAFDPAGGLYWLDGGRIKHLPAAGR